MKSRILAAVGLCAALSGCTYTSYTEPGGARFSRISLLNSQSVGKVTVKAGDKELALEGYSSEQAQVAGAVVSAAVKAAVRP